MAQVSVRKTVTGVRLSSEEWETIEALLAVINGSTASQLGRDIYGTNIWHAANCTVMAIHDARKAVLDA